MRKKIKNKKTPGALKNVMQERQAGCKRNNLRAGEGKQLSVARTKQQEVEEDAGVIRQNN